VSNEALGRGLAVEVVGSVVAPAIAFVAMLGSLADPSESPARPLYLKAVDATPMRAAAPQNA